MADTFIDALPKMGPYGALFFVLLIYVVDRLVGRSDMKRLTENHLQHIQDVIADLVSAIEASNELQSEATKETNDILRAIQKDLALQHQTIDYLWQNRQG